MVRFMNGTIIFISITITHSVEPTTKHTHTHTHTHMDNIWTDLWPMIFYYKKIFKYNFDITNHLSDRNFQYYLILFNNNVFVHWLNSNPIVIIENGQKNGH